MSTSAIALLDPTFFAERVINLWNSLPAKRVTLAVYFGGLFWFILL